MTSDKPIQIAEEYYLSSILRLLKYKGLLSIHDVFLEYYIPTLLEPHRKKAIARLSKLHLFEKIESSLPINSYQSKRLQPTHYIGVKVCPECLKKYGFIKTEWLDLYLTYCEEHQCSLISSCSQCNEELDWDVPLLNAKCSNYYCLKPLKPQNNNLCELSKSQIDDLLIATILLTKDISKIEPQHKYFPVGNVISEMNKTLLILSDQDDKESQNLDNSIYPNNIKGAWFDLTMMNMRNSWPVFNSKKPNIVSFISTLEDSVLMSQSAMEREFNFSRNDCLSLVKKGMLREVSSDLLCHYEPNYDISPLFKELNTLSSKVNSPNDYIKASKPLQNLSSYINTRKLLEALLVERRIKYNYIARNNLYDSLSFFL
ncbi:hypothetical protein [Pseudoalteromonas sp. T1lg24]|uniref:hypothetical protein n=1 Tax=Pseudoalteromonas sp. T1lg24 TaxID=2077099 RepID=UPI000CF6BF8B|nr:hypothetical protein [Pseudoalteromonas sp. T1lg24]